MTWSDNKFSYHLYVLRIPLQAWSDDFRNKQKQKRLNTYHTVEDYVREPSRADNFSTPLLGFCVL